MKSLKPAILYLDDEVNNLTGFKATFRRDYTIFTAQTAEEAFKILKENDVQIVISDQRMPEITGAEFLKSVFENHPKPIRMLLTGFADIESVIKAINEGHVYRYITKPWEEQDLRLTINNALNFYEAQNELRNRNAELEKAYTELEKFVYSASHDLRAPLASVMGLVQLAKIDTDTDRATCMDYFLKIESSVNKLDVFLQNIISYYRNTKLTEERVEINFEKLFKETIESLEHFEKAPQIKFSIDIRQDKVFKSDESRLKIVLNNILSNAIKYQRDDESNKQVDLKAIVENGHARIEVKDNGIGIAPENKENIFSMFYRSAAKNAGSGIGLYIVKETLTKMEGDISVDSAPGEGSKFTIKIPNHHENN